MILVDKEDGAILEEKLYTTQFSFKEAVLFVK